MRGNERAGIVAGDFAVRSVTLQDSETPAHDRAGVGCWRGEWHAPEVRRCEAGWNLTTGWAGQSPVHFRLPVRSGSQCDLARCWVRLTLESGSHRERGIENRDADCVGATASSGSFGETPTEGSGAGAAWPGVGSELLRDVVDRVADRLDLLRVFVRNRDLELVLELHDEFDGVE